MLGEESLGEGTGREERGEEVTAWKEGGLSGLRPAVGAGQGDVGEGAEAGASRDCRGIRVRCGEVGAEGCRLLHVSIWGHHQGLPEGHYGWRGGTLGAAGEARRKCGRGGRVSLRVCGYRGPAAPQQKLVSAPPAPAKYCPTLPSSALLPLTHSASAPNTSVCPPCPQACKIYLGSALAVFYLVGGLAALSAVPFFFVTSPARPVAAGGDGAHGARHHASRTLELVTTVAVVVLVFFTTAAETAIGNWIYTFSLREVGDSDAAAAAANSAFWGAFTVGRVFGVSGRDGEGREGRGRVMGARGLHASKSAVR